MGRKGLTPQQQEFVEYYLQTWNGTQAAIDAKYSPKTAAEQASRLLTNVNIKAAIKARLADLQMSSDEVLARLTSHARGSMGDFLRTDEEEITLSWSLLSVPTTKDGDADIAGTMLRLAGQENVQPTDRILHTATIKRAIARLDLLQAKGLLHLVKKYTLDDKGKVSIELYDAQAALTLLGKHHGLFVERTEHTIDIIDSVAVEAERKLLAGAADDGEESTPGETDAD